MFALIWIVPVFPLALKQVIGALESAVGIDRRLPSHSRVAQIM